MAYNILWSVRQGVMLTLGPDFHVISIQYWSPTIKYTLKCPHGLTETELSRGGIALLGTQIGGPYILIILPVRKQATILVGIGHYLSQNWKIGIAHVPFCNIMHPSIHLSFRH